MLRLLPRVRPPRPRLDPGLYAFRPMLGGVEARAHLRVAPDGSGLVLLNASAALRLSPSGALMARSVLLGASDDSVIETVRRGFEVDEERVTADLAILRASLSRLATAPGGAYPIEDLRGATQSIEVWLELGARPMAVVPELDRLWSEGVPHVTLQLAPGVEASTVVRAVERAEDLGMICGIRAPGLALPKELLSGAAAAGLDCVQVPLLSLDPGEHDAVLGAGDHAAAWDALRACREQEVCPVAEVPVAKQNADDLAELAGALEEAEVEVMALWAVLGAGEALLDPSDLPQLQVDVEALAESGRVHVLWTEPAAGEGSLRERIVLGPQAGALR